jgi:hypothetical protein
MNRRIALLLCLGAAAVIAQDKPAAPSAGVTGKVFTIKYANVRQVFEVITPITGHYQSNFNQDLRTITVSAPPDVLNLVEDAIKRVDVPGSAPKNIELTVWFMVAAQQATTIGSAAPEELQSVVKQLSTITAYKSFRLLDSLVMRCRDGQGVDAAGVVPFDEERPTPIEVNIGATNVTGDQVHITALKIRINVPVTTGPKGSTQFSYFNTSINTNIDVREGQKVVVGKSNLVESGRALVLVLNARVI